MNNEAHNDNIFLTIPKNESSFDYTFEFYQAVVT